LVEVRLLGVPVELWVRASAHSDALVREFDIITHGERNESVPARLLGLIEKTRGRFSRYGDPANAALRAAADAGESEIDLAYSVPAEIASASRELASMLEEADAFCEVELLTMETPEDIRRFRDWFLSEFVEQIEEGRDPKPWSSISPPATRAEHRDLETGATGSGFLAVSGDIDLASADELRERIRHLLGDGVRSLTMDLTDVSFLDSVGLSLLVATHKRLGEEGHTLAVMIPPHLDTLFEISGLKDVFEVRPPRE
jgi:anti-sigma B factor antagonist